MRKKIIARGATPNEAWLKATIKASKAFDEGYTVYKAPPIITLENGVCIKFVVSNTVLENSIVVRPLNLKLDALESLARMGKPKLLGLSSKFFGV